MLWVYIPRRYSCGPFKRFYLLHTCKSIRDRPTLLSDLCLGPDGVSKRYAQYAKTRNETRIILQHLRSTPEQGFTPTKLILDDWFCDTQLKRRSIEDRATHIKRIVSVIGGFNITSITAHHVQKLYDSLREQGLSKRSINQTKQMLEKLSMTPLSQGGLLLI